jgi:hypothetical protein
MLIKLSISLKIDTYLRPLSLKKKTKINNAVYFPTNPILYDKKKIKLKDKKTKKKHILSMGKLVKLVNRVSRACTINL